MIPVNSISKIPLDKKELTVKNLKSGVIVFELARIKLPSITVSSVKTPSGSCLIQHANIASLKFINNLNQ